MDSKHWGYRPLGQGSQRIRRKWISPQRYDGTWWTGVWGEDVLVDGAAAVQNITPSSLMEIFRHYGRIYDCLQVQRKRTWWWRKCIPSKRQYITNRLHCVKFRNTAVFTVTAVKTWDHAWLKFVSSIYLFKHNQKYATLHNGIYYYKCSTCFRRFLRPSSGAQNSIHSIGYLSSFYSFLPLAHASGKKE